MELNTPIVGIKTVLEMFYEKQTNRCLYEGLTNWPKDANYSLCYNIAGKLDIEFFKNNDELIKWYDKKRLEANTELQEVFVEHLFMWDHRYGPTTIDDIQPHFTRMH